MEKITPMMAQYNKIKADYPNEILMFRMGDFYEMFFDDAVEAARILQITLTMRNKNADSKAQMCGIPFHALNNYLGKLTRAGKRVAICDQVTEPTGKGIVERKVIKVVTPGTTFDEGILENKSNNYVSAMAKSGSVFGFAYADITTGEFKVTEFEKLGDLEDEVHRIMPSECVGEKLINFKDVCFFDYEFLENPAQNICEHFSVNSLEAFGLSGRNAGTFAAAMLLNYLKDTQKTDLNHIQGIQFYGVQDFMILDEACVRNLEIFFTSRDGKKEGSLLWSIDRTVTSMGGRMLKRWLMYPLIKSSDINNRLGMVEDFYVNSSSLREVRESLEKVYDIERLLSKLSLGSGNARDLVALKESLKLVPELKNILTFSDKFGGLVEEMKDLSGLVESIEKAIVEEPPHSVREGGMVRRGYNSELDELHGLSTDGKTYLQQMQQREIERTGINSLKIKFNRVFGYYIEISNIHLNSVPADYIRKQTLVNAERYITEELKEYEEKVLAADGKIKELEYDIFYAVRMEVLKDLVAIQKIAKVVAEIDVLSSFAFLAEQSNFKKPVVNDGYDLDILNGRHPVIEKINGSEKFVPNSSLFNQEKRFSLITGPNMGGKSTYLRQNALIILLAQIGCFVPADKALVGVVDRIFTRVGAADNLTKGESTFMVEMQETAYIMNHATKRSFIILDEVGRGTSTYDGVSLAWAIMEYLHDKIEAKTIFATHYHELIQLADKLSGAKNFSVAVRENEREGVVFLHKIVEGGVDKSYGIEVAKLAGLPPFVVSRARGVLDELETKKISKEMVSPNQEALFEIKNDDRSHKILKELNSLDLNNTSPIDAWKSLEELQKLADRKEKE